MMTGHCECGRVQFEVAGAIEDYSHCHCSQCRRLHGAAYVTFAGVRNDDFHYTSGESEIGRYPSSDKIERLFCMNCGSNIMAIPHDEDLFYVSMGLIDGNPPHPPAYHIFVGSKIPWHTLTDKLPQYEEFQDE